MNLSNLEYNTPHYVPLLMQGQSTNSSLKAQDVANIWGDNK